MQVISSTVGLLYEFGPFRLDVRKRVLSRDGESIPLTPKAFDTLLVLVQNSGQPISRTQLMNAVWPDSFVEEANLTQNIFVLRKALGNDGRYIVTIPGRGYQFAEKVRQTGEEKEAPATEGRGDHPAAVTETGARRSITWAMVALGLLLLAGLALLFFRRQGYERSAQPTSAPSTAVVHARRAVAVLGFRNLSGDPGDQWLSTAFSEMLNTELAGGNQLRMVSGEDVARAEVESPLPGVASLSKGSLLHLRTELNTDLVVLGSYTALHEKGGERIRFDLRLQDTNSGETVTEQSVTGSRDQLFQMVAAVGTELRQKLGVAKLSAAQAGQVRASLTANPEAARLYAEGLDKLRKFDAQGARDLLEKAVAADPDRALFHSALAESWSALGYDWNARAEAKKAFDLSGGSSREGQLLVEARYREQNSELGAAAEIYRTLWNFFPDNLEYGLRLADIQAKDGQGKEALQTVARMRRSPELEINDARIDLAEAAAAESLSDFAHDLRAASAAAAKAQGRGLLLARALYEQGYAYMRLGRPAEAITAFGKERTLCAAAGDKYGTATATHMIAMTQYYKGDFAAASLSFQDALRVFRSIGALEGVASCSHNLAMLLHDQGKLQQARDYLDVALRIQRDLHDERGVAADLDDIGNVLLSTGDLAGAAGVKEQAAQAFHHLGNRMGEAIALGNLGEVLFVQGKFSAADQKFEESLELKQKIGYKRGMGFCWMELATVLLAQNRLAEARTMTLQALTLRQQLEDEFGVAQSRLQLAQIAFEQDSFAEAESQARNAVAVFDKRKASDSSAIGYAVLSRALLAENKISEAQAASNQAMDLLQKGGDREGRFQALLAGAAVQAALGRPAKANHFLQVLYSEATRYGYAGYELEARLRLGELEMQSQPKSGRDRLARVQRDAAAHGFLLIGHQARMALQGVSP